MYAEKYVHVLAHFYDSKPRANADRMRFEIVVAPPSSYADVAIPSGVPDASVVRCKVDPAARELLEVFVDGANVTTRVRETHGVFVLRDLALALTDLGRGPRAKAAVRFYDEPWEMCIERFGSTASVSVYRTGADPQVSLYDRAVPFDDVVRAVRSAIDRVLSSPDRLGAARLQLAAAAEQLRRIEPSDSLLDARVPEPVPILVDLDRKAPLSFGAEFAMRGRRHAPERPDTDEDTVERADLHALLFRGRLRAEVRGHAVDLGECHPLLVAERLVEISRCAYDAWERGLASHARGEAAGILVGVRITSAGDLTLTLGAARNVGRSEPRAEFTFPALGAPDLLEASLTFGRALVRAVLRHDRTQSSNLRLGPLRRSLREATEALHESRQSESKENPTPETYRAFAASLDVPRTGTHPPPAGRLRYTARWQAIVPGIDLRATFLCGDRLVVGSATEMWALDRTSGQVLWRSDVLRGTSVVTPGGVARLAADGKICVYDLGSGQKALTAHVAPRIGGPVAGAVVHLPGLPRLLIVTEGEHHLVAVDLGTGEPSWRWSWVLGGSGRASRRPAGIPRMKRAGRLVYFTSGDGALTALDVITGSVVWRLRDRLRFRTPPTVTHDALFVVAGGARGVARLHCIDPYSGRRRWSREVTPASAPCTVEGAPLVASRAVAVAVRHKTGLRLAAFERECGEALASGSPAVAPSGTSWLAVDDCFVGNAPTGELVAVDAATGEIRWRQVLGPCPLEADVPRRLEPVLRNGALFVPHAEVVVVRPSDGAVLGVIAPTEAIPDLLRVDERGDVYIAEESGHLVGFGALPRLSLVPEEPRRRGRAD